MHPVVVSVDGEKVNVIANYDTQASAVQTVIAALGPIQAVRRGGRVVPVNPIRRTAFRLLRWLFGDRGRVAAWTRTWSGPWLVVVPTGALGPFADRDAAVQAEVEYLLEETNGR